MNTPSLSARFDYDQMLAFVPRQSHSHLILEIERTHLCPFPGGDQVVPVHLDYSFVRAPTDAKPTEMSETGPLAARASAS